MHVCKRPDWVCPDWTFNSVLVKGFFAHLNYLLSVFYAPQKLFKCLLSHVLDHKFSINNKSPPQLLNKLCYHLTSLISVVSHNSHKTLKSTFRKSGFYSAFRLKQLFIKSQPVKCTPSPLDGVWFFTFGPLLENEVTCWPHMIWDPQVGPFWWPQIQVRD